jgi:hypothetical protein
MELLVVLVIVALISSVLMGAFSRVLDIRERLATFLDGAEAPVLVGDWFRDTIDGLVPDAAAGDGHFTGTTRRLTGLSLAPLDGPAGVQVVITWEVVFDSGAGRTHLRYHEGDRQTLDIASWPGGQGGLRYCDADFACGGSWPPNEKASQLPLLIWLDAVKGDAPWPILAAPRAAHDLLVKTAGSP